MLEMAAVYHLAQQQVEFEHRLTGLEERYGTMADFMRGFVQETRQQLQAADQRLNTLGLRLDPVNQINVEQQAEVMLAVRNLAHVLEEHGSSNGHQKVYSELYRRYNVNSYKTLPRSRFDAVMAWLRGWFEEVTGQQESNSQ